MKYKKSISRKTSSRSTKSRKASSRSIKSRKSRTIKSRKSSRKSRSIKSRKSSRKSRSIKSRKSSRKSRSIKSRKSSRKSRTIKSRKSRSIKSRKSRTIKSRKSRSIKSRKIKSPKAKSKFAVVSLLMMGDGYLPGILIVGKSVRDLMDLYKHKGIDLVCLVTPDISEDARKDILNYYDRVIEIPYIEIPYQNIKHTNIEMQKIYAKTFTKLYTFTLVEYEKIVMIDADMVVLNDRFFSLFDIQTPAGIFLGNLSAFKPSVRPIYDRVYGKYLNHGELIPDEAYHITCDDIRKREGYRGSCAYLGVETSICLLQPSLSYFNDLKHLILSSKPQTYKSDTDLISRYFQGKWHHIDLTYLGRWIYPPSQPEYVVLDLYGMEGKPWQIDRVGKIYREYPDIQYWVDQYITEYERSFEHICVSPQLSELYNYLVNLKKTKKIRILVRENESGLKIDAFIIKNVLESMDVEIVTTYRSDPEKHGMVDIQFHLEHYFDEYTKKANKNYFIINHEFLYDWDIAALQRGNVVALCKTKYAQKLLKTIDVPSFLTKFMTPDLDLFPTDKKDAKLIVHLAGTSFLKGTRELLYSWFNYGGNKLDTRLFITRRPSTFNKSPVDLRYWDSLSPIKDVFEINGKKIVVERKDNVYLTRSYLDGDILRDLIMTASIHLCPSLMEGWGHIINQGRMAGAVVITSETEPMNELIQNGENGLTVQVNKNHPFFMPELNVWNKTKYIDPIRKMPVYPIHSKSLIDTVRYALSLSPDRRRQLGERARKSYLEDTEFFMETFTQLVLQ